MKRIAILGTDSSHTEVYASLLATDAFASRATIAGIWGADLNATRAKADALGIANVCESPEAALDGTDGAFVLSRFAEDRTALAERVLDRGLPAFIDKSLAADARDAQRLVDTAQRRGAPLLSCSPYRFAEPVVNARRRLSEGGYSHGAMIGPRECTDLGDDPRYASVDFYGIHSAEVVLEVFGSAWDPQCVLTPAGTFALVRGDDGCVCSIALLSGLRGEFYRLTLCGLRGVLDFDFAFDGDAMYRASLRAVLDQLFNGIIRVPPDSNVAAVALVATMRDAH